MPTTTLRVLPALMIVAFSGSAAAAAFQLWEQNASGLGNAFAGSAAVADNASTIFFNPAGMARLSGGQFSLGVAGVRPSFKFKNAGSSATFTALGSSNGGDAGGWSALPNAYLSWQLSPQWFAGLGLSAPFGLKTEYRDASWIGRYNALKSEITTANVNPALAYKLSDRIALGFGINYQKIDAEMSSLTPVGNARLKGDDSAWGWNAGALVTLSPAMRLGLSYRSAIDYKIEGNQTIGASATPATAKVKLPDTFIISVWQQLTDRWEAMGDLSFTRWNSLDRLDVISRTSGATIASETFGYQNSWRFAYGATYKASDIWKLKFGIGYDRTPTTDSDRSARVPDNNRIWLSIGGQWRPAKDSTLDFGYAYLYVRDPNVESTKTFAPGVSATLRGKYSDSGNVLGIQYSQGF